MSVGVGDGAGKCAGDGIGECEGDAGDDGDAVRDGVKMT